MRIPPQIPIDRELYTVVFGDAVTAAGDGDKDCVGHCDFEKKIITLDVSLRRQKRKLWWVFWHEVYEAINHEYGLNLAHDSQLDRIARANAYLCEDSGLDFPAIPPGTKKRRRPRL